MIPGYMFLPSHRINTVSPVFLPVGSLEIHGRSLPLGTDTIIAAAFSFKFAEKTGGTILPPLHYGVCPNTGTYRETVSISHEGFISYAGDILRSFIKKGFERIIVVNIHKGNDAAINLLIETIFMECDLPVYYLNPYTFLKDELDPELFDGKDNSYKEASLLLAALHILGFDESRTNLETAQADETVKRPENLRILKTYGTVGFRYLEEAQHIGARKNVDRDSGLRYIERASERIPEIMRNFDMLILRHKETRD